MDMAPKNVILVVVVVSYTVPNTDHNSTDELKCI